MEINRRMEHSPLEKRPSSMQVTTGFGPERERFEKEQVNLAIVFHSKTLPAQCISNFLSGDLKFDFMIIVVRSDSGIP